MKILKEITEWETGSMNHTYLISNSGKLVAYAKWHSDTDVQVLKSRASFDKRYRKFVEVKHAALAKIAKQIGDEVEKKEELVGRKIEVKSDSGKTYIVTENKGRYTCSCPGFTFRGKCKHIDLAKDKK